MALVLVSVGAAALAWQRASEPAVAAMEAGRAAEAKPAVIAAAPRVEPPPAVVAAMAVRVKVKLDSEPPGAEVFRAADGLRLGTTPLVREYERSDGVELFVLKLAGYREATASVSLARDTSTGVLLGKRAH
jgi:serine/threonine-protein kinase